MKMALPSIIVRIGADTAEFKKGMADARDETKKTSRDMAKIGATVGKFTVRLAAAGVAVAGAVLAAGKAAGSAVKEIKVLSDLAGVGTTEFQRLAEAGRSVNFSQEKMADIFKDVNDKFGDFMSTGAGPLADFFENIAPAVGVTAEQFARLSGPEALQLYVSSLEKAGVGQQQMTFYMEALASDATALLPLLRNNGTEMKRLGDEAQAAGRVLDAGLIAKGVELDKRLSELSRTLQTKVSAAILEYSDEIVAAADFIINNIIPAIDSFITKIGEWVSAITPAVTAVTEFIRLAGIAAGLDVPGTESAQPSEEDAARDLFPPEMSFDNTTGTRFLDENGNVILDDGGPALATKVPPKIVRNPKKEKTKNGGGGASGTIPTAEELAEDLARLQEGLMTETEALDASRAEQLAKLEEFRQSKVDLGADYNDIEERIQKEHADKLAAIERASLQLKLQAVSGALGDLSSLMQSENKKLFAIGKTAALAQGIIDGYSAALTAWDKGMELGGPPVAAAFTAASLAKTGMLLSQIKSASPNGGGGGAGIGGGAVGATAAAPAQAGTYYNVTLTGGDNARFSGADVRKLMEQFGDEIAGGSVIRGLSVNA